MSGRGQVRFEDIVKMHGDFTALKGVNFKIEPGEFFALLGPSGSGKSTTLRILAGLDAPTAGRVFIDGKDVTVGGCARPRHRHGVPELRALPAHDGGREHRVPARDGEPAEGGDRQPRCRKPRGR